MAGSPGAQPTRRRGGLTRRCRLRRLGRPAGLPVATAVCYRHRAGAVRNDAGPRPHSPAAARDRAWPGASAPPGAAATGLPAPAQASFSAALSVPVPSTAGRHRPSCRRTGRRHQRSTHSEITKTRTTTATSAPSPTNRSALPQLLHDLLSRVPSSGHRDDPPPAIMAIGLTPRTDLTQEQATIVHLLLGSAATLIMIKSNVGAIGLSLAM